MRDQNQCRSVGELFTQHRAPFVIVRDGQLHIGNQEYPHLIVQIHEVQPVRKFFQKRTLNCYSLDCHSGKGGQLCELCSDRHRCSQRLQLRLGYQANGQLRPAILEIPKHCFQAFDQLISQVGTVESLLNQPVAIKAVDTPGHRFALEFELVY